MAKYVDGFVLPLPKKNLAAYKKLAQLAAKIWIEHGALTYHECVAHQLDVPMGVRFDRLTKAKKGETVVLAWIVYKSRAHRDRVNAKVMKDPRMATACDPKNMPFDMKRMTWGGFESLVEG